LDRFADYAVRYAYGDEVKTIRTLGKKNKIGEAFAKADNAVVFYGSEGLGVEGSAALAAACTRLLDDTDHLGRPNNGLVGVWQRANDQGAWELGFRAEADLAKLLRGKAVYVVGADPAGDDPKLAKALAAARFVVVQDILESATARMADVVLPAQAHMERDGTFTSGERRVQRFHAAVPAPGETRPDFSITAQIARNAGFIQEGTSLQATFEILSEIMPAFAGLTYDKLGEVPEQWPIVGRDDLYYGGTTQTAWDRREPDQRKAR
jgi:NADH-quinone oxidoreductase subunit G